MRYRFDATLYGCVIFAVCSSSLFFLPFLHLFGFTYLCEQTFSARNLNKIPLRLRLTPTYVRFYTSTTTLKPDQASLCENDNSK